MVKKEVLIINRFGLHARASVQPATSSPSHIPSMSASAKQAPAQS